MNVTLSKTGNEVHIQCEDGKHAEKLLNDIEKYLIDKEVKSEIKKLKQYVKTIEHCGDYGDCYLKNSTIYIVGGDCDFSENGDKIESDLNDMGYQVEFLDEYYPFYTKEEEQQYTYLGRGEIISEWD